MSPPGQPQECQGHHLLPHLQEQEMTSLSHLLQGQLLRERKVSPAFWVTVFSFSSFTVKKTGAESHLGT